MAITGSKYARLGHAGLCRVRRCGSSTILAQGLKFALALLVLLGFQWLGEISGWRGGYSIARASAGYADAAGGC